MKFKALTASVAKTSAAQHLDHVLNQISELFLARFHTTELFRGSKIGVQPCWIGLAPGQKTLLQRG